MPIQLYDAVVDRYTDLLGTNAGFPTQFLFDVIPYCSGPE
jgi:hypothetical protein